ncbi:AI-2E family transporter [Synechococcus sp. MIT S9452]|uniref:AI-2E family transporter n=1 Tax=Synechococcus sp. MIT S9452 TaxID=3082546 RepID=UPI0039A4BAB6
MDSAKADGQTTFGRWVGFAALIAAVVLLWDLRSVLIDLFGSVVLAVAFCTLVRAVKRRLGWRRWPSLLLSLLLVLLLVIVVVVALVPPFSAQFRELIEQLPRAAQALQQLIGGDLSSAIQSNITNPDKWNLANSFSRVLQLAGNFGIGLVQLVFVVAVALMLSVQPDDYRQVAVLMAPSYLRRRIAGVLDRCGQALSSWMVGVLISSVAVGLMAFVGLSLLGVKLTTANALLAGMLNVIPNVGPTLSVVFPMAVALLDNPWMSLAVLALYVVIQNFESYVITPSVMHHQVKLLPGLTLAAQLIFTVIFGFKGLLLALPLAVCLQVVVRELLVRDVLDTWKRPRRFC